MPEDLAPLEAYRDKLALFSGYDVKLDGVANKPHITGCLGLRTGIPVPNENVKAPTLDVLIAQQIGGNSRFRSLELSTCGLKNSYSYQAAGSPNPSETSPAALYRRIFGEGSSAPHVIVSEHGDDAAYLSGIDARGVRRPELLCRGIHTAGERRCARDGT